MVEKAKKIQFPVTGNEVSALSVGDPVLISGQIVTGRDRVHQFLFNTKPDPQDIPFPLDGSLLYHCGPIIRKEDESYTMIACGPTTSARVEMYEWWVIQQYGIKAVMGKGGMGDKTVEALKSHGAVYLHAIGGAASYLAQKVKSVLDVWKLEEFGIPEAMWLFEVADFPAVVTIDAHGNSLHKEIFTRSEKTYRELIGLHVE